MKLPLLIIFSVFLTACGGSDIGKPASNRPVKPAVDRGEEIVAEYVKRDSSPYRKDRVRFTVETKGETAVFELDVWRRMTDLATETLSVFVKPAEDAGTASLAILEKGKPAVNVTYSRSRDEYRETDTGKRFFGGLTAEELLGEWSKYEYRLLGEVDHNGIAAYEVEGKLKEGQSSTIAANKFVFHKQSYLPVLIRLYDTTGREIRTYSILETRTSDGRNYPVKTEAVNHVYNSRIMIEVLKREYPEKLDDTIFTREKLKELAKK
jgi:hypothetical protein